MFVCPPKTLMRAGGPALRSLARFTSATALGLALDALKRPLPLFNSSASGTAQGHLGTRAADTLAEMSWLSAVALTGIVTDVSGNLYLPRYRSAGPDYGVTKLDSAGVVQWTASLASNASGVPVIAVDASGNVYLLATYMTGGAGTQTESALLTKFSPSGARLWQFTYAGSSRFLPRALALDASGNPVVCALSGGAMRLFKLNGDNGTITWARTYSQSEIYYLSAMALDAQGNIFGAGYASSNNQTLSGWLQAAFDPNGVALWASAASFGQGSGYDLGPVDAALAPDGAGAFMVTFAGGPSGNALVYVTPFTVAGLQSGGFTVNRANTGLQSYAGAGLRLTATDTYLCGSFVEAAASRTDGFLLRRARTDTAAAVLGPANISLGGLSGGAVSLASSADSLTRTTRTLGNGTLPAVTVGTAALSSTLF